MFSLRKNKKSSNEVRVVAEVVSPKLVDDPVYKETIKAIAQELGHLSKAQDQLKSMMVDTCDMLLEHAVEGPKKPEIHTGVSFPGYETVEEYRSRTGRRYPGQEPVWKGRIADGKVVKWDIRQYGSQDYKHIINLVYYPGLAFPREGVIVPESLLK